MIENGLNIERPFLLQFPDNIVLSGVSWMDAHEVSLGVIEQNQKDHLKIGVFNNPQLDLNRQITAAKLFVEIYSVGKKYHLCLQA